MGYTHDELRAELRRLGKREHEMSHSAAPRATRYGDIRVIPNAAPHVAIVRRKTRVTALLTHPGYMLR